MNKKLVDVRGLIKANLSADQYVLLSCIYEKRTKLLFKYIERFDTFKSVMFEDLIERGYLDLKIPIEDNKYTLDAIELTDKFEKVVLGEDSSVNKWINEWYDLWPKGITSGGYPVRSDKAGCLKKMKKFILENEYNKEQIFQATENYITKAKNKKYTYIRLAPYFIEKEGISMLSRECELIKENIKVELEEDQENKTVKGVDNF